MNPQRVHYLNPSELRKILDLHKEVLSESTLNKFGPEFLKCVYRTTLSEKEDIFLVLKDKEEVAGYLLATPDINNLYHQILFKNFLKLTLLGIKIILINPSLFLKTLQWLLFHNSDRKYPAELQFLAIDPKYQRKGLGTKLINSLKKILNNQNIRYYKVGTRAENPLSNNFYKKTGFSFLYTEKILGNNFNYYLSPKLK